MNVQKINANIRIKPTEKKIKKTEKVIENIKGGILPKELPIEKEVNLLTEADIFQRIKDKIQIAVDNMKGMK